MSSGFVKTSILAPSETGAAYDVEETKIESEDVRRQTRREAELSSKPLFEQLESNKEKEQEEYDRVTKLIFAPPQALDEEDVHHFNSVKEREQQRRMKISEHEESEIAAFTSARLNRNIKSAEDPPSRTEPKESTSKAAAVPSPVKPQTFSSDVQIKKKRIEKRQNSDSSRKRKKKRRTVPIEAKQSPEVESSLCLLTGYASSD
uniref:FAM192A/Fyv6 N-terminal domain-containing protein n=1 Tax=Octactis speculum TaxID=3111310 RepID=A0A7S2C286_9STRA|mmetsp:Transcript_30547/g.41386  ORF Transcript_30547/g.41386 Transcript_30547/m.41386 type:complete len:204 (+) Transcript_30547:108-719(+)|eukprot:CAMPEP_0185773562 /NCGR_PEP_ID=MMETSP1174-20130828/74117_1 /TAXON_ID=35687 /ORGANISM="Dictyocha speculum, Strain CCMP1381" /LENGTH=203 /DNA_ID=CAMNT_0028460313 /DNA_START=99 /DNA_END=710 /DNA_ORIENTATION=+